MRDMTAPTELLPDPLAADPLAVAQDWLQEAWNRAFTPNPNAMTLATSTGDGHPSARIVLCKDIVPQPGYVMFYTNYRSRKGRELGENPRAAAVLHWDALHRQVRIEGIVDFAPAPDSDRYFASRALQSRVGAWASAQSEPIASRADLLGEVSAAARRFGVRLSTTDADAGPADAVVPRPPHWGGYRLWADAVELWVEGAARIHERARWSRPLVRRPDGSFDAGAWSVTRLQP
jgi:pyridoxamine 5'-phosphate oxidase